MAAFEPVRSRATSRCSRAACARAGSARAVERPHDRYAPEAAHCPDPDSGNHRRVDDASREIVLVLHWHGGRHTELRITRPWSGPTRRCTDAEAIALVRRMAGRWDDDAIAMQLNLLGWRTGTGNHWTRIRVRELRSRLELPACDPTQPAWLTAKGRRRISASVPPTPVCCSSAASFRARKQSLAVCGGSIRRPSSHRSSVRRCVR